MLLQDYLYTITNSETTETGKAVYTIRLLADCPVYKGHFPGNPITPGVCLLQIVGELLALAIGAPAVPVAYKNVKFLHTLSPSEGSEACVGIDICQAEDGTMKVKASVYDTATEYTRVSATYRESC